ncbi:MAG: hypothetical protein JWO19_5806, partial [Bryobacterales bacterium]|nr:hypothetical protein [Bryobacterales bacterium]
CSRKAPTLRSLIATVARLSIWSAAVGEAERLRVLPQHPVTRLRLLQLRQRLLLLRNALEVVQVAAALEVEASAQQPQPKFALFCRTRPPRNNAERLSVHVVRYASRATST